MRKSLLFLAALLLARPQVATAETPSDHAWLNLGVFRAHIDSHLRLGNERLGIEGTKLDFEKDLGLDSSRWMPSGAFGVRFLKRFRIEGEDFRLARGRDFLIKRDLIIDDTLFPVAVDVHTHFRTDIYRLAVGYSFVRRDNAELGLAVGAHVSSAKFGIEALNGALEEHRSKSAPLPNVGLYGNVRLWGPITAQGNIEAFKLKVGNYKGTLLAGQLGLNYRIVRNLGLGLGYRYAHYKIQAHTNSWDGAVWYSYSGPTAYLELAL
jgi:hypothetical protein